MAQLSDILQQEHERGDESQWNVIHLYKTGSFYSAYEWSAWLIAVITFNDAVRMQTKDRKPLAVTRIKMKNSDDTFCRVGFPLKSVEKYIPTRLTFDGEDDKHVVISVPLPQPTDGTAITYERLAEAVSKWKEEQSLKQPKDEKDADPAEDTDRQPPQGKPRQKTVTTPQAGQGLIAQIMSYPLNSSTPMDNYAFIQRLQQQIATIL